jgi:hypothetical protein
VLQQPYVLKSDNRQEQMSFLGLSVVLTITNSGVTYSGGWQWYHIIVVVFVVVVSTGSMVWIQYHASRERASREARVAKGEKDLREFTRRVFSAVVPTFLLLKDNDRAAIRKCIQVETFECGETIYSEGDKAHAFFIIKDGLVTISSLQEDRTERTLTNGDSFGAGALETDPRKRVATATVTSKEVICLRLIREDWLRAWMSVTDQMATEVFNKLDITNQGCILSYELETLLLERWAEDATIDDELRLLVRETVEALMVIFDDDGDGKITLAEFKRNLRAVPADDYVAAISQSSDGALAGPRCPFHYFHVNPRNNCREAYTDAENAAIFAAQSSGLLSVQLTAPYEVRFGENACSSKMAKPSHTGMCQVNLENENTRVIERVDIMDKQALVRCEAAPVAAQEPTTHAVYQWKEAVRLAKASIKRVARCEYFHIDPTNNRRCAYSEADNATIMAAENAGAGSVRVSDVLNPHTGQPMHFELRFGSNARSDNMQVPSRTGICQVNLDNQNTRRVVCVEVDDSGSAAAAAAPASGKADDVAQQSQYVVTGAGTAVCNGAYLRVGDKDGVPSFRNGNVLLFRYALRKTKFWYLADQQQLDTKDGDYYRTRCSDDTPPLSGWQIDKETEGAEPAPSVARAETSAATATAATVQPDDVAIDIDIDVDEAETATTPSEEELLTPLPAGNDDDKSSSSEEEDDDDDSQHNSSEADSEEALLVTETKKETEKTEEEEEEELTRSYSAPTATTASADEFHTPSGIIDTPRTLAGFPPMAGAAAAPPQQQQAPPPGFQQHQQQQQQQQAPPPGFQVLGSVKKPAMQSLQIVVPPGA